jgi:hypothetical protein
VENKETVFVTQKFDGKEIKNIYHVEVSPETYFRLERLRRELKLETHNQVIQYLLALVNKPSLSDKSNELFDWLINNISCLNNQQRKRLLEAIKKHHPHLIHAFLEKRNNREQ